MTVAWPLAKTNSMAESLTCKGLAQKPWLCMSDAMLSTSPLPEVGLSEFIQALHPQTGRVAGPGVGWPLGAAVHAGS